MNPTVQQTEFSLSNQLGYRRWSINLNSNARPDDERTLNSLGTTADWLLHLVMAIYMFVIVNFDALAQTKGRPFSNRKRQVTILWWGQDSKLGVCETHFPADWMQTDIVYVYACKLRSWFNTLRPIQIGRRFADDVFKCIFLDENVWILLKISLKFGDKPLSELMMVSLLTHVCVTRPQWV